VYFFSTSESPTLTDLVPDNLTTVAIAEYEDQLVIFDSEYNDIRVVAVPPGDRTFARVQPIMHEVLWQTSGKHDYGGEDEDNGNDDSSSS
jgi:hypothetical protein